MTDPEDGAFDISQFLASLVGFGGAGQAVDSTAEFGGESEAVVAGGGGVRYLISRVFGLQVGIDVAQGPEDTAVYIQIGN